MTRLLLFLLPLALGARSREAPFTSVDHVPPLSGPMVHITATQDTSDAPLRLIVTQFVAAWGRADADALAALFTLDGDLVIPTGEVASGRAKVRAFYAAVFAHGYAGSTTATDIVHIRRVAPEVVLVDATWSITGAVGAGGAGRTPERGILAAVAVRRDGVWQLAALREQTSATRLTSVASSAAP